VIFYLFEAMANVTFGREQTSKEVWGD